MWPAPEVEGSGASLFALGCGGSESPAETELERTSWGDVLISWFDCSTI